MIAERILALNIDRDTLQVPVRIFAARKAATDWACRFTIGWPEQELEMDVFGVDGLQAIELALRTIGVMLYTSEHHRAGKLMWLEAGDGYGFPITSSLRDLLVGSDKRFF